MNIITQREIPLHQLLEETRKDERENVLIEIEQWLDEMPIWVKIEGKYGYDPIHNKADISPFRQGLRAKLQSMKGNK